MMHVGVYLCIVWNELKCGYAIVVHTSSSFCPHTRTQFSYHLRTDGAKSGHCQCCLWWLIWMGRVVLMETVMCAVWGFLCVHLTPTPHPPFFFFFLLLTFFFHFHQNVCSLEQFPSSKQKLSSPNLPLHFSNLIWMGVFHCIEVRWYTENNYKVRLHWHQQIDVWANSNPRVKRCMGKLGPHSEKMYGQTQIPEWKDVWANLDPTVKRCMGKFEPHSEKMYGQTRTPQWKDVWANSDPTVKRCMGKFKSQSEKIHGPKLKSQSEKQPPALAYFPLGC